METFGDTNWVLQMTTTNLKRGKNRLTYACQKVTYVSVCTFIVIKSALGVCTKVSMTP